MNEITTKAKQYSKIKYKIFFISLILSFVFLGTILYLGISHILREFVYDLTGNLYAGLFIFLTIFGLIYWFSFLPLDFYSGYMLEHKFNLSNQSLFLWIKRYLKQNILSACIALPLIELLYFFLKNYPETWWVLISIAWIFFSIVLVKLTPIFIIPLFYKLTPLKDGKLKERLAKLVLLSRMRVRDICEVNLSKDTKKASAAFTGIGKSRRILLSDTLLSNFSYDEIEVILAHEVAHKKFAHIWKHLIAGSALTFLAAFILKFILDNYSTRLGFSGIYDIANFPFLMLYFLIFEIVFLPLQNAFSRHLEAQADKHALVLTKNKPAFISAMEKLASQNLADKEPPILMELLIYDHPPIAKRIKFAENSK
ncbi:MAG: M48 family metallopeptidase [Candidatus Omnitrophica bacterium]|nr:M48 family metallopeptidase [Candidatus Omnitrophota bacterium]